MTQDRMRLYSEVNLLTTRIGHLGLAVIFQVNIIPILRMTSPSGQRVKLPFLYRRSRARTSLRGTLINSTLLQYTGVERSRCPTPHGYGTKLFSQGGVGSIAHASRPV